MKTPVFVFNSLNVERGGLTKAVMKRANMLAEHYEEVVFFTLAYQQDHKNIIEKLYKSGQLSRKVKVRNFYTDLLDIQLIDKPKKASTEVEGFRSIQDNKSTQLAFRYYDNGYYKEYRRFNGDGSLKFIDYMDESRTRLSRAEFLRDGRLVRTSHMDHATNKPKLHRYLMKDGSCKLTAWVNPSGSEGRVIVFGNTDVEYDSIHKAYAAWIGQAIKDYNTPVLLSDSRKTDETVLLVKAVVEKIAVAHNNHFESPYDESANTKKSWTHFTEGINSFDHVVFLTNEQEKDITSRYDVTTKLHVIPHAAPDTPSPQQGYNPKVAVTLARFEPQKRLDEGIAAFKHVVERIPDAEYHIYGMGPLENDLKKQIKQLGLEQNVKLLGFSSNPAASYQSAACTILTSDFEGFGMVLTETLAAGTPAVSYDIKYGPKDIIRNDVDGYLVKKGDQKALAEKVVAIMKDSSLRDRLSARATEVTERFSEESFKKDWVEMFGQTYTALEDDKPKEKKRSFFGFGRK
ncbi:glycosyltransferase [Terribacillus sp. 179-K 1B1 HS]|uniref:glycosyltransferase n=1 Tax=Terribacillus sp. 179-K 1B1 HS TaxID=3142388 RepID=UPI00399F772A